MLLISSILSVKFAWRIINCHANIHALLEIVKKIIGIYIDIFEIRK